jgi:hypothetical protein
LFCGLDGDKINAATPTQSANSCGSAGAANFSAQTWTTTAGSATTAVVGNLVVVSGPGSSGMGFLKSGQTVNYKVGYSYKQTSTSTAVVGVSPVAAWTLVDGASTLVMTGVAAALAALAF